jgi:hypothetical protein
MKHYTLLSDAILDGARLRPQGYHAMEDELGHTCALGAASHAMTGHIYLQPLRDSFEHILAATTPCPVDMCDSFSTEVIPPCELVITHLNDFHEWTREQIAAFVATVEESLGLCEIISDEPVESSEHVVVAA